ncbi:MAG TPA: cell division protein FtsZ, partial [Gammaproteobacteria bacterium]|nr:cell division protein FtsZ [Gammaproteobacteria bacterium]
FEGRKRMQVAMEGMKELTENVDSLITIPNEKLLAVLGPKTSLLDAFKAANDVLLGAVQGIADLIIRPGMINVDFADVRTVMSEMGMAMMGTGFSAGENRAREAAEKAIRSPLLEDVNLQGARGILVNITAGESLSLGEFSEVGDTVEEFASENATVVVGTVIDPSMGEDLRVTVVATGLGAVGEQVSPVRAVEGVTKRSPVEAVSDYKQFDKPAVDRIRREPVTESRRRPVMESDVNREYLDIPTFLRRQAD